MRYLLILVLATVFYSCNETTKQTSQTVSDSATTRPTTVPSEACKLTATAAEEIKKALSLQVLEGMTDEEARKWKPCDGTCQGLTDQLFDTLYNDNCILEIKRMAEYMGAYPSTGIRYFNFDKATGKLLTADDIFITDKIDDLLADCRETIKMAADDGRKDLQANDGSDAGPDDVDMYNNCIESAPAFTSEYLDKFSIEKNGITIHYEFEFPHAILAWEPSGDIHLSKAQLKPYLRPDGPLGFMLK